MPSLIIILAFHSLLSQDEATFISMTLEELSSDAKKVTDSIQASLLSLEELSSDLEKDIKELATIACAEPNSTNDSFLEEVSSNSTAIPSGILQAIGSPSKITIYRDNATQNNYFIPTEPVDSTNQQAEALYYLINPALSLFWYTRNPITKIFELWHYNSYGVASKYIGQTYTYEHIKSKIKP